MRVIKGGYILDRLTEMLVKQHMAYCDVVTDEMKNYCSIYDHMLHFFTTVLRMPENLAIDVIEDFSDGHFTDLEKVTCNMNF